MHTTLPAQRLKLETERAIFRALDKVAQLMDSHGTSVKTHTQKSLKKLSLTEEPIKLKIFNQLNILIHILSHGQSSVAAAKGYTERELLSRALDKFSLKLKHEDFWASVGTDEMIEVYNTEDIQIFRTLNFFKTSSYSLLDLLINEWFQLWERPSAVLDKMFSVVQKIHSLEITRPTSCNVVPEHVIKEIYNAEDSLDFMTRSSLCKFNVICPLYDINDDSKLAGFLVSSRIVPFAFGEETKTISFI